MIIRDIKLEKCLKNIEFVCDFCGKREKVNGCDWWGGVHITPISGYGSKFDPACVDAQLDFCDDCFEKIIMRKVVKR